MGVAGEQLAIQGSQMSSKGGTTFASYGTKEGDRESLMSAVPDEHKLFLSELLLGIRIRSKSTCRLQQLDRYQPRSVSWLVMQD